MCLYQALDRSKRYVLVTRVIRNHEHKVLVGLNEFACALNGKLRLSRDSKQMLLHYNWPGNVRELNHLLSRAQLKAIAQQGRSSKTVTIQPIHLDISTDKPSQEAIKDEIIGSDTIPDGQIGLKEATDRFQQSLIANRLSKHNGNRAAAARELGLDRGNFYRLLKRLDL